MINKFMLIALFVLIGCTAQQRAKHYGGTMEVKLDPGSKLVNATWKNSDLWLLVREANEGEVMETYKFKEVSNHGIWEGTVVIKEQNFESEKNGGD